MVKTCPYVIPFWSGIGQRMLSESLHVISISGACEIE